MDLQTLAQRYSGLPSNWRIVPLCEVLEDIVGGGTPPRSDPAYWSGDIPWLTVKDMRTRRPAAAQEHISARAVKESATSIIPPDTVITATRVGLGKVIRVPFAAAINQDLKALIVRSEVEKAYLEYWILSIAPFLEAIGSGTTVKGIRLETLRQLPFPLAPVQEQRKIVAEIEKQLSRVDEAVASLKRSQANLHAYRHVAVREAIWGDRPAGPTADDLPLGWSRASLSELGKFGRGKSKHRPRDDPRLFGGPYPFIQTGDVRRSAGVIHEYTQTYSELGLQQSRLWPQGTLCITIAANIAETGILAMPACFPDSVVGFVCDDAVLVRYVELYFRTIRANLERFAPATAQKNINLSVLERIQVPLPPASERERIVAEVDRRLSIVREVESEVEANMKRAQSLWQAVLTQAFVAQPRR